MRFASLFPILAAGLALSTLERPASGQSEPPLGRDSIERLAPEPRPQESTPPRVSQVDADPADAVPILIIAFDGAEVPGVVADAALGFVGRPASRANLEALAAAMSAAYGRSDVALFTILIPQQNLSDGEVRVRVREGHVEAVVLTGDVEGRPLTLAQRIAERLMRERPASRRSFERTVALIEAIPGVTARPRIELGETPGGVRLFLDLRHERASAGLGFDTRTTRFVDDGVLEATGRAFGLLRDGDESRAALSSAVDGESLRSLSLEHSTPLGGDGLRLALSAATLQSRPQGLDRAGRATRLGAAVSYPLVASRRRTLTLGAGLDGVDSENATLGAVIATERSRAARLTAIYAEATARRGLSAAASLSQGLEMLDASVPESVGDAAFLKLGLRGGLDERLPGRLVARLRASLQWTEDVLPAAERFSAGGERFGRAFETGALNADRGLAGLAEIAWRPLRQGTFRATELYGFADAASGRRLDRPGPAAADVDLSSAGVGARLDWRGRAHLALELARGLDRPGGDAEGDWRLNVAWRLSLQR